MWSSEHRAVRHRRRQLRLGGNLCHTSCDELCHWARDVTTFWALDIPLYEESAPTWPDFTSKASPGTPAGVLLGYIGSGKARSFRTAEGLPVLVAANQYDDTPERIAERIRQVVTQPPSERPPVLFISAHVSYQGMVDELLPLEEDGVHFLLPSEAFACVP